MEATCKPETDIEIQTAQSLTTLNTVLDYATQTVAFLVNSHSKERAHFRAMLAQCSEAAVRCEAEHQETKKANATLKTTCKLLKEQCAKHELMLRNTLEHLRGVKDSTGVETAVVALVNYVDSIKRMDSVGAGVEPENARSLHATAER